MFLKQKSSHNLIEVLTLQDLWDPCITEITGRLHAGEEMQDPEPFRKVDLIFPSDEPLPACWLDPDYRHQGSHTIAARRLAHH